MSLINKMLKDIDARQAQAPGMDIPLSSQVRSVHAPARAGRMRVIGGARAARTVIWMAVFMAMGGAAYLYRGELTHRLSSFANDPTLAQGPGPEKNWPAAIEPAGSIQVTKAADQKADSNASKKDLEGGHDLAANATVHQVNTDSLTDQQQVQSDKRSKAKLEDEQAVPPQKRPQSPMEVPASKSKVTKSQKTESVTVESPMSSSQFGQVAQLGSTSPKKDASVNKKISPEQLSAQLYQQGLDLLRNRRMTEAQELLQRSLDEFPAQHAARLALARVLIETQQKQLAQTLLERGQQIAPQYLAFHMALAHLQVQSGDPQAALASLQRGLPYASEDGPYQSFLAGLLERSGQHGEATKYYVAALKINPNNASSLVGLGISLQAQGANAAAAEAFQNALDIGNLPNALAQLATERLSRLKIKN